MPPFLKIAAAAALAALPFTGGALAQSTTDAAREKPFDPFFKPLLFAPPPTAAERERRFEPSRPRGNRGATHADQFDFDSFLTPGRRGARRSLSGGGVDFSRSPNE